MNKKKGIYIPDAIKIKYNKPKKKPIKVSVIFFIS